jgi:hypothetical protein
VLKFISNFNILQEKLVILYEQEIMRCYYLYSRDTTQQKIPFSFCSIIKDDEIYSQFKHNNDPISTVSPLASTTLTQTQENNIQGNTNTDINNSNVTGPKVIMAIEEKLFKSLNELKSKFQKLKDDLIKRQLHESDSLHAVQKMDFESIVRDVANKYKIMTNGVKNSTNRLSLFKLNDIHVPIVHVNNKFELFENSLT